MSDDGELREGVVVLPDSFEIEDRTAREDAERLIEDAGRMGCMAALRSHKHNVDYLVNPTRTKYVDLLGLRPTDEVLEIGSSMGQHTRLIAARAGRVSALEVVRFQSEFSKLWCDEEGLRNVRFTAGGGSGHLPYDDGIFDVVISNYVLEWCAGRSGRDANDVHRDQLAEIRRVLKPGGRLFLTTKNRFALKYVTGIEDEHLGIRFGSALPRWLQKRLARPAGPVHSPGHLHSWAGLRSLLVEAGFRKMDPLFAFPDARYPLYLGRDEDFSLAALSAEDRAKLNRRDRLLAGLPRAVRLMFSNSLVFMATA